MTHIVVISQVPPPHHGSTVMTERLLNTLKKEGYQVTLVDRRFSRSIEQVGVVNAHKIISGIWLLVRTAEALRKRPSACILFTTNRMPSFALDVAITIMMQFTRMVKINYIHTSGYRSLASRNPIYTRLVRQLLAHADITVTLGESLIADIDQWTGMRKLRIIRNSVPDKRPDVAPLPSEPPTVLFLSNLLPEKGPADFIQAAAAILSEGHSANFVLIGAESSPEHTLELEALIKSRGVAASVKIVGPQYGSTKEDWLSRSSMFVFPSTYALEAQPLSVIESMSFGLPTVAYKTGGISDMIKDGHNGLLIQPGDVAGLADGILRLILNPELRAKLGNAARMDYVLNHAPEAFRESWSSLLLELLPNGASAR